MSRQISPPTPRASRLSIIAPVNKGGTGAGGETGAVNNIGGISTNSYGAANGIARSDATNKVPTASLPDSVQLGVSLKGPSILSVGQTGTYVITNFDSLTNYVITLSAGSYNVNGDTISVITPTVQQNITLTINGKAYVIVVGSVRPAKPTVSGFSTNVSASASTITLTGSTFASSTSTAITHLNSDWEIYSDSNLSTLVASSLNDSVNKVSWSAAGLTPATVYYGRVRYRSTNGGVSDWSNPVTVVSASAAIQTEEAILTAADKVASASFGNSVSVSSDGTRVVIGAYAFTGTLTSQGKAYVFLRTGTTWTQEAALLPSDPNSNAQFGFSVAMSGDGSRLIVGANQMGGSAGTNQGKAYIFLRTDTTWTQEAAILPSDQSVQATFGFSVAANSDGSRMAIGARNFTGGGTSAGKVYIFLRIGTSWVQETGFQASDRVSGAFFGHSISMSSDASRIVVGAQGFSGALQNQGKVYIFLRTGSTWTQEAAFLASDPLSSANFGWAVSMSSDGSRIVIGANNFQGSAGVGQGKAYVYLRTGTTWALEASMFAGDPIGSAYFGYSVSMSSDGGRMAISASTFSGSRGKVYMFSRNGVTWTQESSFTASNGVTGDNFGRSVSLNSAGNLLVVGAYFADPSSVSNAGAAYIYK